MISRSLLQKVIDDQQSWLQPDSKDISREFLKAYKPLGQFIEIVTGVRRCGKTTVLKQIFGNHLDTVSFLNFEDPRLLDFGPEDYEKLVDIFPPTTKAFVFDEIQNAPQWESFVRLLHSQGKKVYATGSNAAMLSKELGTSLTGRNIQHELFPFSYSEYCIFTKQDLGINSFNSYLLKGGFPDYLELNQPILLQQLFKEIIIRDIGVRFSIRNTHALVQVALHLISNIGKEFSYNKIRNLFQIGSPTTVSDYCIWLDQAYLFFYLPKFSWSPSQRMSGAKKVYSIDNGLIKANSLSLNEDTGRLLENMVFLHFRRTKKELYYFRDKKECDFLIFDQGKCTLAIQVCADLNSDNEAREISGLIEAMDAFGLKKGFILTLNQIDNFKPKDMEIDVVPAWKFCS